MKLLGAYVLVNLNFSEVQDGTPWRWLGLLHILERKLFRMPAYWLKELGDLLS